VGWTDGWKMFRGLKEANCCARGRAHSGLASSNPLCVFQESLCRAQRPGVSTLRSTATPFLRSSPATEDGEDGRRPSAAFPRGISNYAWVNWNCYTIPISEFGLNSDLSRTARETFFTCVLAPWRLCVKEFNGMYAAWSVVRSLLPVVPCSLISAFQISKFQYFRHDPQPSPCGIAAIIPRGETLNSQPSSHHVPNVYPNVPYVFFDVLNMSGQNGVKPIY